MQLERLVFGFGFGFAGAFVRAVVRAVSQSVLNDDAGAGRRSMATIWGHAAGVRGRRASVAHQCGNYFFPAQGGGGARKGGAGLR